MCSVFRWLSPQDQYEILLDWFLVSCVCKWVSLSGICHLVGGGGFVVGADSDYGGYPWRSRCVFGVVLDVC